MKRRILLGDEGFDVNLVRHANTAVLDIGGRKFASAIHRVDTAEYRLSLDGFSHQMWIAHDREITYVHGFGRTWQLSVINPAEERATESGAADAAKAPMPGVVVSIMVSAGEAVAKGQPMVIIESMKMQSEISAHRAGIVDAILVAHGEAFESGARLVSLVAEE